MCGIAGFVSLSGARTGEDRLARMIGTLRHRGPDDRGRVHIHDPQLNSDHAMHSFFASTKRRIHHRDYVHGHGCAAGDKLPRYF